MKFTTGLQEELRNLDVYKEVYAAYTFVVSAAVGTIFLAFHSQNFVLFMGTSYISLSSSPKFLCASSVFREKNPNLIIGLFLKIRQPFEFFALNTPK